MASKVVATHARGRARRRTKGVVKEFKLKSSRQPPYDGQTPVGGRQYVVSEVDVVLLRRREDRGEQDRGEETG